MVDALNRTRGPFNVNAPAIAAGAAAIADDLHVAAALAHNEEWLPRLTREFESLGLEVTPSVGNFLLIHFPTQAGRTAGEADAFLAGRGLILRAVAAYELPNALRMTIGSAEANQLVIAALGEFMGASAGQSPWAEEKASVGQGASNAVPLFGRVALIGLGLVGSSIARAARRENLAGEIVAIDCDRQVVGRVRELDIADIATSDLTAVAEADLVILCVPVGAFAEIGRVIGLILKPGAIVSDTGSVKASVIAQLTPHLRAGVHLVPAHPVAGTEYSGPDAGFATLFQKRWCILTPPDGTDPDAIRRVETFWRRMGAEVEVMSAEHHDLVLAITSHVPHLIAYNIVGTAADLETVTQSEVIKFSAGGFRDFTRIAASDPTMWRDVFLHNKPAVLEMLGRLNEDIAILARAIRWGDGDALFDLFTRTRAIRRGIISEGQETAEPDFGRRKSDV